jgi:hypothetical protein
MQINSPADPANDKNAGEEKQVRRKFGFLLKFIKWCLVVVALISVAIICYRIYIIQTGDRVQGVLLERAYSRHSTGVYQGHFSYKGKLYKLSEDNFINHFELGPVDVYVNPKNPNSYFVHPTGTNKYWVAISTGKELEGLFVLIVVGLAINYGLRDTIVAASSSNLHANK